MKNFLNISTLGLLLSSSVASATIMSFDINQTFAQGGVSDLPETTISLDGAGSFSVDPGRSGSYFDFKLPGAGTFSTISTKASGYFFLDSYVQGELIDSSNFGNHRSGGSDWDTILSNNATAGVWGNSHDGYLGFLNNAGSYGYIEYEFKRTGLKSEISFLSGAYNDQVGQGITASVPAPATVALLGLALVGFGFTRKEKQKS